MTKNYSLFIVLVLLFSCKTENNKENPIHQIAKIAPGWQGEIVFESNER